MAKNGSDTSRYTNPDSVHNVAAVRQMFPFEGLIDEIELRGICVEQLKRIRLYAHTCGCHWWDHAPKEASATAGQMLTTEIMNFHHLGAWLVKPATKEHRCSFSELFPRRKACTSWFVSHAWTQRFVDFLAGVQSHAAARGLTEASPYWVCAFAQRLHTAPGEGAPAMISEGVSAALTASQRLLVCTDGAFDRLWCCYERFLALRCGCSQTDVVTTSGEVSVLLDSAADSDLFLAEGLGVESSIRPGLERPSLLPLLRGMDLQVELTSATSEVDRKYILNTLADTDLRLPPPDQAQSYLLANSKLRSSWATLLWRPLVEDRQNLPELAKQVAEGRSPTLTLNFGSCDAFDDSALGEVAAALHEELREVRLNLSCSRQLSSSALKAFIEQLPRRLEQVEMDLRRTAASPKTLAALVAAIPAEAGLSLGVSSSALAAAPPAAPQLRALRLDLDSDCDLRQICAWLPGTLQSLALQISEQSQLTSEALGNFLLSLPADVEHLALCTLGPAAGPAALAAAFAAASQRLEVRFGPGGALDDSGVAAAAPLLQDGLLGLRLDLADTGVTTGALQALATHCKPRLQHVDVAVESHRIKSLPQLALWRSPEGDNEALAAGLVVANAVKELLPTTPLPPAEVYDLNIMSRVNFGAPKDATGEEQ